MSIYTYPHPQYVSTTRWEQHGLQKPISYNSFLKLKEKILQLCPCVFASGYFFHWEIYGKLFNTTLICSNDILMEEMMWMLTDLIKLFAELKETYSGGVGLKGPVLQKLYTRLRDINEFQWPARDTNSVPLILNLSKDWKHIGPDSLKLPWYLLSACNQSLLYWTEAELLTMRFLSSQSTEQASFNKAEFSEQQNYKSLLLIKSIQLATYCPTEFQKILQIESTRNLVVSLYWIAQQDTVKGDLAERHRFFKKAVALLDELAATPGGIDEKFTKIQSAVRKTYESEKARVAFVTGCAVIDDISDVTGFLTVTNPAKYAIDELLSYPFPLTAK